MGIQSHFNRFHDTIKLGRQDDAYKSARERDDSITKAIKEQFAENNYAVESSFIQGSFSTHTGIVSIDGDFDIDRGIVIADADAPANPVDPKKAALAVLEARGFQNAKIKKPCVVADYASEALHIDFPIYKRTTGGQHFLAIGKKNSDENNREWAPADPLGLIGWVNEDSHLGASASKKHDQFRRIVRYMKRWRDVQFGDAVRPQLYSIGLTVMFRERFVSSLDDEGMANDLEALRSTVESVLNGSYLSFVSKDTYSLSVQLPTQPWLNIFEGSSTNTATQLRNKLTTLKSKLVEAEALEDVRKQCQILKNQFGEDFFVPDPPTKKSARHVVHPSAGFVGTSQGA